MFLHNQFCKVHVNLNKVSNLIAAVFGHVLTPLSVRFGAGSPERGGDRMGTLTRDSTEVFKLKHSFTPDTTHPN